MPSLPDAIELIAPVPGPLPCGEDLSFSTEFDDIQEARREDDPGLDQGEWVTALKEADWKASAAMCQQLLKEKTKDLRLASWLTEALSKTDGVRGMARGLELVCGLSRTYWDQIHPVPEDGDQEQRIGNISWLITRCIQLTRDFPVVEHKGRRFSFGELDSARALQSLIDRNQPLPEDASERVSLQQIRDTQRSTPRSYYENLIQSSTGCLEALSSLSSEIDERLGMDGPSFTPLRSALETYAAEIERIARENGVRVSQTDEAMATSSDESPDPHSPVEASAGAGRQTGPLRTREQALQQLRDVADFFRRTEPHSPVAYLADKAASWGEMPLHVWLKAVLKEEGSLSRFEDLLGFESSSDE
ncbi:type VI secretion system protein TssA [Uliginosibacterium paludis]|uniref:Type VI secretion system protein TssA n=1 Tax=Uliginosibacterium paludis TaxID=1615952 RepID=A0ABV2CRT6_9RHOO